MKEFLEDLEALLIKHPDIALCSRDMRSRVVIYDFNVARDDMESEGSELTPTDIQRFKRELEDES